jgi:fluoride exporter
VNPVILFAVFFGGGLGSVMRHFSILLARNWFGDAFPYGTLFVNVLGCFIIGALMEIFALKISQPAQVQALLVTGFLGGFTTFSSFSLDVFKLVDTHHAIAAAAYVAASVFLSLIAVFASAHLFRAIL